MDELLLDVSREEPVVRGFESAIGYGRTPVIGDPIFAIVAEETVLGQDASHARAYVGDFHSVQILPQAVENGTKKRTHVGVKPSGRGHVKFNVVEEALASAISDLQYRSEPGEIVTDFPWCGQSHCRQWSVERPDG
ncbi:MAG: hypothetical protein OXQ31_25580 [Spirochaetaceae bacterium]|nr:hypothetical protein [Spirochaetaceae bacterium]